MIWKPLTLQAQKEVLEMTSRTRGYEECSERLRASLSRTEAAKQDIKNLGWRNEVRTFKDAERHSRPNDSIKRLKFGFRSNVTFLRTDLGTEIGSAGDSICNSEAKLGRCSIN